MSLLLYTSVESACAQKVRLVLAEKELDWQEHYLNLRKGEQFTKDYLRLNPKAVVPTLVHNQNVICESSVINEYLDDCFPEPQMKPADPVQRSRMRLWVKTVDDEVHPAIGVLTYVLVLRQQMNAMKSPEQLEQHFQSVADSERRERQQNAHQLGVESPGVKEALSRLKQITLQMEQVLCKGDWLAGGDYSLADAAMAPYLIRLELLGLEVFWKDLKGVERWLARMRNKATSSQLSEPWGSEKFIRLLKQYAAGSRSKLDPLLDP